MILGLLDDASIQGKGFCRVVAALLRRALHGSRGLYGCEKMLHVERKVVDAVVFRDGGDGAKIDAFLGGVCCNVCPYLLEEVEYMSATQVCRCRPVLSTRAPEE